MPFNIARTGQEASSENFLTIVFPFIEPEFPESEWAIPATAVITVIIEIIVINGLFWHTCIHHRFFRS